MKKLGLTLSTLALVGGVALAAGPTAAPDPKGDWMVADGTAVIRIDACGAALCGNIAWTKYTGGLDEHNPDPTKRTRPILGLPILLDMKPSTNGRWDGEVYNAENGKTYASRIWLKSADVLRIEGCVFGGLFCGGEDWTRTKLEVPKDPPKSEPPKSEPPKSEPPKSAPPRPAPK